MMLLTTLVAGYICYGLSIANFGYFVSANPARKTLNRMFAMVGLPVLSVSFVVGILYLCNKIYPYFNNFPKFSEFDRWLTVLGLHYATFLLSAISILFSGGTWLHGNKSGGPDRRYKYNEYYANYSDAAKWVTKLTMVIPMILLVVYLAFEGYESYSLKK